MLKAILNTKDMIKHITAMLLVIILGTILILGIHNVIVFTQQVEQNTLNNAELQSRLIETQIAIEILERDTKANEEVLQAFKDMYERDKTEQKAFNNARSELTNESVHLYVDAVVMKYIEVE